MALIQVVKTIEKSVVHPQTGEKVKRSCTLTLPMVDLGSDSIVDDALQLCGGDAKLLAQVLNSGVWNYEAQQTRNELAKVDPIGKALAGTIKSLKTAVPDLTEEAIRTMLMANPQFATKASEAKFEKDISITITTLPASDKFPDVSKAGGESEESVEDEEESKE